MKLHVAVNGQTSDQLGHTKFQMKTTDYHAVISKLATLIIVTDLGQFVCQAPSCRPVVGTISGVCTFSQGAEIPYQCCCNSTCNSGEPGLWRTSVQWPYSHSHQPDRDHMLG